MEIGAKIRRIRVQRGLTQEELADRCELSKGFISQLERDLASPSIATLIDILECLGTDLRMFFNEEQDEKVVFGESDVFIKEDSGELKGCIRWLIPSAQKNSMEPILVEMEADGQTMPDSPHEGEEFGYVLQGTINIILGDKRHKAKKDESFYFRPTVPHYLKNAGKTPAKVIWVSTPPSF